jgi:hypothetical protein
MPPIIVSIGGRTFDLAPAVAERLNADPDVRRALSEPRPRPTGKVR